MYMYTYCCCKMYVLFMYVHMYRNLMVTQFACIHVHVSYYGMKIHLGCVPVYRL